MIVRAIRPFIFLFPLFALVPGAAQAQFNPFSAIKGAFEAVVEDRSADDIAKDLGIKAKITARVIDKLGKEVISINSDVYEQDVMLTGAVEKKELKAKAEALTREIEGVKKIYNEIRFITAVDREKGVVEGFVEDTVIEGKINALLLDGRGVNVTNFRWRSIGGDVYLFGRALDRAEKAKATRIAKGIKNVKSVTNLAKVKPKK